MLEKVTTESLSEKIYKLEKRNATLEDSNKKLEKERELLIQDKELAMRSLAAGLAHNFNNNMGGIQGYIEMLLMDAKEGVLDPASAAEDLERIMKICKKTTLLTNQLQAYTGKSVTNQVIKELNTIVENFLDLEEGYANIKQFVKFEPKAKSFVNRDKGQIELLVGMLVDYAKENIPDVGYVHVKTEDVSLDKKIKNRINDIPKGEYVVLSVSYNANNIKDADIGVLFEPFYSKQNMMENLGLAPVKGILKGHGAYVDIERSEDKTSFNIYFNSVNKEMHELRQKLVDTIQYGVENKK